MMNPSVESSSSAGALVVFGPNQIDTSRAEMLVQCLNDKIKEKRYKLQKILSTNEEKKKRYEMMKSEKTQLTTKLNQIEQENTVREQQLQSEQSRIKEYQFNLQLLDEHNNSIKRDLHQNERKYEIEKSNLIQKFERVKQQWTDVFKPQYENSRVYQYLKQSDVAYNALVERKETLLKKRQCAYEEYRTRREQCHNEKNLQSSILTMAKYYLLRRDQLKKIDRMREKLLELGHKQRQLLENKMDKMKAWENVYNQPVKRDLMDFCLQSNIEQALTLSFHQIQQDTWSQSLTPNVSTASTPVQEQIESPLEDSNPTVPVPLPGTTNSTITFIPNTSNRSVMPSSVAHLTTAIDDDDDALFSKTNRQLPTDQMQKMSIHDHLSSTQAFAVTSANPTSNHSAEPSSTSAHESQDQTLTQAFTAPSAPIPVEFMSTQELIKPILVTKLPETGSFDAPTNKSHLNVSFQLAPPRAPSRSEPASAASIHPQVTSTDVQQMLLTFSPRPSSTIPEEQQPQPMEEDRLEQTPQQQRPNFSMLSSLESTASAEEEYTAFNYSFAFGDGTVQNGEANGRGFTSPINFENWAHLGSPMTSGSNDQFSTFLQQTNTNEGGVDTTFTFPAFDYGNLNNGEVTADGAFGAFFFGNGGSPINDQPTSASK